MQKMVLGRSEGRKERRTELHRKVTQVRHSVCMHIQHSETQCGARSPSSPPSLPSFPSFPPFPEAVPHSSGDEGSLPFPSPLGLPPLHRTHVPSLAHLFAPLSLTARGRSLVRLLLAPIRTMNDSLVLAPGVPNRRQLVPYSTNGDCILFFTLCSHKPRHIGWRGTIEDTSQISSCLSPMSSFLILLLSPYRLPRVNNL